MCHDPRIRRGRMRTLRSAGGANAKEWRLGEPPFVRSSYGARKKGVTSRDLKPIVAARRMNWQFVLLRTPRVRYA